MKESNHDRPNAKLNNLDFNIENEIISKWAKILDVPIEKIRTTDNLFEFGGDSIQVAELVANIEERYEIGIPLEELYESPSILTLHNLILSALENPFKNSTDDIEEGVI